MSKFKLRDELGTRYPCDWHTKDLRTIFNAHVGDICDLAGCNFTPDAFRIVEMYYNKITFINSTNTDLDTILKHNTKARDLRDKGVTTIPIKHEFEDTDEVADYIINLEPDKILDTSNYIHGGRIVIIVAALISMIRPNIVIDLRTDAESLFKEVRTFWVKHAEHHDWYWECNNCVIIKRQVIDGVVKQSSNNLIEENQYIRQNIVLPVEFGTTNLSNSPEFSGYIDKAFNVLQGILQKSLKMKDYLEMS